uniref:Galectin domain-containing protein n=1 Tax=Glossina palpalis gambiensis TaxID=67801 RepID=A0A1B0AKL8_9MUSC
MNKRYPTLLIITAIIQPSIVNHLNFVFVMRREKKDCWINRLHIFTYRYHVPSELLKALEIKGQIQVIKEIDHRTVFPNPWPAIHSCDYFKVFNNDVPILFCPGYVIVITARCFGNKKGQFIIKFMDSDTKRAELHFIVTFD